MRSCKPRPLSLRVSRSGSLLKLPSTESENAEGDSEGCFRMAVDVDECRLPYLDVIEGADPASSEGDSEMDGDVGSGGVALG